MFKVDLSGLKGLEKRLASAQNRLVKDIDGEFRAAAMEFEALAKRSVTQNGGDRGTLKQSIGYRKVDQLNYEVFAGTFYAPFIEFGTKSKAVVPAGLEDVASQFKGQKGTGTLSLIEAITKWVKRKKIGATYNIKTRRKVRQTAKDIEQIAFLIARSIYRNGIAPKPFFYKHTATVRTNLYKRLNAIFSGI